MLHLLYESKSDNKTGSAYAAFGRYGETGTGMVSRGADMEAPKGREPVIAVDRRFGGPER